MKNKLFTRKFVPAAQIRRLWKGMVIFMKKCRVSVVAVFASVLLAACAGSQDITTEKTTEQTEEPVIVLGDEDLPEVTPDDDKTQLEEPEPVQGAEQDAAADSPSVSEDAVSRPVIEGPILVIGAAPKNAVLENTDTNSEGGYSETLLCEDGKVRLLIERVGNILTEGTASEVQEYYAAKENWQQITLAEQDEALSGTVGYPVYRFLYTTGEGEESVMHNSMYVACNEYGFFLDASSEASDYPDMEGLMNTWIETVRIVDEG